MLHYFGEKFGRQKKTVCRKYYFGQVAAFHKLINFSFIGKFKILTSVCQFKEATAKISCEDKGLNNLQLFQVMQEYQRAKFINILG